MNYSPIIVPVVALVICFQLFTLAVAITAYRRFSAYPSLPVEEIQAIFEESRPAFRFEHLLFCVVCFALASMGAGSGLGNWMAWIYVASWATSALPGASQKMLVRRGTWIGAHLTLCALPIYAAVRLARDVLNAFG